MYNAILAATWLLGRTTYRISLRHRTQLAWPTPVQCNGTLLVQVKCPFPRSFSIYPKSQTVALRKLQPLLRKITMKISLLSIFFGQNINNPWVGTIYAGVFQTAWNMKVQQPAMSYCHVGPGIHSDKSLAHSRGTAASFELYPNCRPKARRFQRLGVENHVGAMYRIKMESWMHLQYGKYHRLGIWSLTRHPQQECCQQVPAVGIRSSEALAAEVAHSTWAPNIDKKTKTLRKHSVDLIKCCIFELPGSVMINSYGDQYLS